MDTNISQELIVVQVEGESRIDSRVIALRIDVQHESIIKTIREYEDDLSTFGVIRWEIGKPSKGSVGGRPTQYALLNKDQFGALMMYVRVTPLVRTFRMDVYKKFLEYEKLQAGGQPETISTQGFTNQLWLDRARLFSQHTKIPHNMFCIFLEIYTTFFNFTLRGYKLPEGRVPDGSVGSRWAKYARNVLKLNMSLTRMYDHIYPDQREVIQALIYPIEWLPQFRLWFNTIYIPENLPEYMKYLKATKVETRYVLEGLGYTYQIETKKYQEK